MKLRYLPLAAAGLALLTGCGGSPAAGPTASPAATSTPTQEPADPKLASMMILADGTVAKDGSGNELATLDYFGDAAESVATLSELFGYAPAIEVVEPYGGDGFIGTRYQWDGFQLSWNGGYEDQPGSGVSVPPYEPSLSISTDTASVGEVVIEGFEGIHVGDSMTELVQRYPGVVQNYESSTGLDTLIFVGQVPVPPVESKPDLEANFAVVVSGTTDGTVENIGAPTPNFRG